MLPIRATAGAAYRGSVADRDSIIGGHRASAQINQEKIQQMQDQKERLLNENRQQMNDMFGTGKKEMYNSNVREGIQNVDA